jgi:hypothetical protein
MMASTQRTGAHAWRKVGPRKTQQATRKPGCYLLRLARGVCLLVKDGSEGRRSEPKGEPTFFVLELETRPVEKRVSPLRRKARKFWHTLLGVFAGA